jgi:hypothetical protein
MLVKKGLYRLTLNVNSSLEMRLKMFCSYRGMTVTAFIIDAVEAALEIEHDALAKEHPKLHQAMAVLRDDAS